MIYKLQDVLYPVYKKYIQGTGRVRRLTLAIVSGEGLPSMSVIRSS
jgi:hypothetical protein